MDEVSNVIQFVPRSRVDARENLVEFVRVAREELTAFGGAAAWDSDRWHQGKAVAVFATATKPLGAYAFSPMADPFKQFAKAYVRYAYSHRPVVSVARWIGALRCIEAALLQVHGEAEVDRLDLAVMDVSAIKCRKFYRSPDVWFQTGNEIARVFEFCRQHNLIRVLAPWQSPFSKQVILTEDLGAAGKTHREARLPSNASMLSLAEVFCRANDKESQFFSSIMVLLMVAPGRIGEVLRLPLDCIGFEPDERGNPQMYLRWWAAKGMGFTKKWIIPAMWDVVTEAVRRLTEIGAPARVAARFAFDHAGEFLGHEHRAGVRSCTDDVALSAEEFCLAMGLDPECTVRGAGGVLTADSLITRPKWIIELLSDGSVTYRKLTEYVCRTYRGPHWPFIDKEKTIHVWNALCLHREREFHHGSRPKPFSWRLPTANEVNSRLEASHQRSLFERFGLRNPDGSPIKLTTHQLRHWLSTMSERAGMDDYTLAQWAGRARVADNRHYDHRTSEERLSEVRDLVLPEKPPLLERFKGRQPVTYGELGVDRLGTAKPTLYGLCVHDYSMTPCTKSRQCMTCTEHACIKGDVVTLERIKLLEAQLQVSLDRAQEARQQEVFGADRWVDHYLWELAHTRTMRLMLENPTIPDGTPLRIPSDHDPSPVKRALMDLGIVSAPDSDQVALPVAVKPLPSPTDA